MANTGEQFIVTGWKGGNKGTTLGLRFGSENAARFVRREWRQVLIELDGVAHAFPITDAFWRKCPEVRGAPITAWMLHHGIAAWPLGQPPRMIVTYGGSNRFSVRSP